MQQAKVAHMAGPHHGYMTDMPHRNGYRAKKIQRIHPYRAALDPAGAAPVFLYTKSGWIEAPNRRPAAAIAFAFIAFAFIALLFRIFRRCSARVEHQAWRRRRTSRRLSGTAATKLDDRLRPRHAIASGGIVLVAPDGNWLSISTNAVYRLSRLTGQ
ncbi:MAG TPA: hypothetical protein VNQ56_05165 [Pseudolabrys sp.]|nr:hypothetical protein [Pseudolabrys sp.]